MRLAVIADIHGNFGALCAVLEDISRRNVDTVLNLGDHVSGPLQARETADLLMSCGHLVIRGNHDRQVLDSNRETMRASDRAAADLLSEAHREWLASLPATAWVSEDIFLCHGTPASDCEYFLEEVTEAGTHRAKPDLVLARAGKVAASLILCGHTHIPGAERLADGRLIVNPGSAGLQAYRDELPFPHKMETGSPNARYAVLEKQKTWDVQFVQVSYDWETTAKLAESHCREDWAKALRTGIA